MLSSNQCLHYFYLLFVILHILAAKAWIGGMAFLILMMKKSSARLIWPGGGKIKFLLSLTGVILVRGA
ncbi:MAG: hypothetical protein HYY40_04335 [Bacteroidetes bacterium]|nr:hypothetical protein [Bacteroidota bacterium]